MRATAVVIDRPGTLSLRRLTLRRPEAADVLVAVEWTGISTGTERLLWRGDMPAFPGMGYPLVPGYEAVGRVVAAGSAAGVGEGDRVFVGGSRSFPDARCLFGSAANRLVVAGDRAVALPDGVEASGVLLALAATAHHLLAWHALPELVVGHGALGRLVARLVPLLGGAPPVVWELDPRRREGALGYDVRDAADEPDDRRFASICDVTGDAALIDTLVGRLVVGGELVLGGFYSGAVRFDFPLAFRREARLRVAAEWTPADMRAVVALVADGRLSLDGIVTDVRPADAAPDAYRDAFADPACVKMALDWRNAA